MGSMTRAERRRAAREQTKRRTAVYNMTEEQLDAVIHEAVGEKVDEIWNSAFESGITTAMILNLTLPCKVLMDHYWTKSYQKRLPEFVNYVLEYYEKWQNGEWDIEDLRKELWEYGGVRFEEVDPTKEGKSAV